MNRHDEEADQSLRKPIWVRDSYDHEVSIILVNYKTPDVLRTCLQSLGNAQPAVSMEIIVVDNDSRDASVEMVRSQFPHVVCIASKENTGHTGGCNLGMAAATGRHLFLLNVDTRMRPGVIDSLHAYLGANPGVGAVAPKVLNEDGTIQGTIKRFPTPAAAFAGRYSLLTRLMPRNRLSRNYLVYLEQDLSKPLRVDSASAAALMVRRETVQRAGALDQRFFMYWNDVDWCRSIWKSGFEIHYLPSAALFHDQHKGGTERTPRQSRRSVIDFHRGAYRYFRKWDIPSRLHPMNLVAILGLTIRAFFVIGVSEMERYSGWRIRREATVPDREPHETLRS